MNIKQIFALAVLSFVVLPLLIIGLISGESFKEIQTEKTIENMQTIGVLQKQRIAERMDNVVNDIKGIIDEIGVFFEGEDFSKEKCDLVKSKFLKFCNEEHVLGMALYDKNDNILTVVDNQNGAIISYKSEKDSKKVKEFYVSKIIKSETIDKLSYIKISVPIFNSQGEYIGAISQFLDVDAFGDLLRSVNAYKTEQESIINCENEVFVSDSMFYEDEEFMEEFLNTFSSLKKNEQGLGVFFLEEESKLCFYYKIQNIDWYYVNTLDKSEIISMVHEKNLVVGTMTVLIVVFVLAIALSYAGKFKKKLLDYETSMELIVDGKKDAIKEIPIWKISEIDNLGNKIKDFFVTSAEAKKEAANMVADSVAYKKAIEITSILVFDASLTKNKVISCNNGKFSFQTINCDEFIRVIAKEYVHSAYQQKIMDDFSCDSLIKSFWEGEKFVSRECLYHNSEDSPYQWISINAIIFSSEINEDIKSVFYIQNINERKEKELSAIEQSQLDPLTGIYNKKTTKDLINEYIYTYTGTGRAVFVIMDIDNFKSVNDTFGHIVGDDVICDVADRLKKQFRGYDIIGRIGGDEFVVFLKDIDDYDLINNIVANVITAIHYPLTMKDKTVNISVSAGISIFPDKGKTYNELYRQADSALYTSKSAGKNRYTFYNGDGEIISHDPEEATYNDLELKKLYDDYNDCDSKELKRSLAEEILRYIGTKNNISRIYNIILDESQKNFYSTLEWCNEGIPHNMLGKAIRSLELDSDYIDCFDEGNVFACRDVRQLDSSYYNRLATDGVIAILQYSEIKNGKIVSCVGFDDCREKRYWSDDMVKCLYLVKKLSEECY